MYIEVTKTSAVNPLDFRSIKTFTCVPGSYRLFLFIP